MRALVLLLPLVVLAGCGGPPVVTPVPTPTVTPVFASDEEALAAAEEAYGAYLAAVDLSLATGDGTGLRLVAEGNALEEALDSVEGFIEKGEKLVGQSSFTSMTLISQAIDGRLESYVCLDISQADVVDATGSSIVPPDRASVYPMHLSFEFRSHGLLVSESEVWDGENFCA